MYEFEKGFPPPCCPKCKVVRDERFQKVRELIKRMPGITALEVHVITGVPLEMIMQFVRDGDIEAIPIASEKDMTLDERIGMMVKKAKEKKAILYDALVEDGGTIDGLNAEEKDVLINWLFKE